MKNILKSKTFRFHLILILLAAAASLSGCAVQSIEAGEPAEKSDAQDLALNKPVRVTSTGFWRTPASHITDGDPDTGWRAASSDPMPYYVEVDLQGIYQLNRIHLVERMRGGGYRMTGYGLFVSSDRDLWAKVDQGATVGTGIAIDFDTIPARYIRLWITSNDGLDLPMIAQIAAFGPPGQPSERTRSRARPAATDSLSSDSEITAFSLREADVSGEIVRATWPRREAVPAGNGKYRFIEEYEKRISLVVPRGTDLTSLTPVFESNGEQVHIDGVPQESGVTQNDFRESITYTVVAEDGSESAYTVTVYEEPSEAVITVYDEEIGNTMPFVGYSAMNLTQGDNLASWYRYSNVNAVRYWLTPGRHVGEENVTVDDEVTDPDALDERKNELRRLMLARRSHETGIDWQGVADRNELLYNVGLRYTTHYALTRLRELGIEMMAELNDSDWAEPFENEEDKWQRAWVLWQMFYAQSFYLASKFDVWNFQGPNEPDHQLGRYSGSAAERAAAVERFVFMNSIYADAMRAAVADVNELYGKSLKPLWGGPTLASSPTADISLATMQANRTNYRGETVDSDIVDLFVMQSYSGHASSFTGANESARNVMREHNPSGVVLPIAYTEFNYMPGSVWRNQSFTSDAPHVFRSMARVWSESMMDGIYGMFQFRIARPMNFGGNHMHLMFRGPQDPARNILYGRPYSVSSEAPGHPLANVLLNATSSHFAWKTAADAQGPHEVIWDLEEPQDIRWFLMNLGSRDEGLTHAALQYWDERNEAWKTFPGGEVRNGSVDASRPMETHNSHIKLSNIPTVIRERPLEETIRTRKIRFYSESPGPITVRRIYLSDTATNGDVGGPMKSAEVTRLFAEGFKGSRPLYRTEAQVPHDPDYKAYTAYDAERDRFAIWIPQTSDRVDYETTLDFSRLPEVKGGLVTVREVSPEFFGDVVYQGILEESGRVTLTHPRSSVWLVTLQRGRELEPLRVEPGDRAMVGLGTYAQTPLGSPSEMIVRQNTAKLDLNRAIYLKFDLTDVSAEEVRSAVFNVHGNWATDIEGNDRLQAGERFTIHLYGIDENEWNGDTLTGASAPNMGRGDSVITGAGSQPLGVISLPKDPGETTSDITDWIRERVGGEVSLVLVRERRHENEINDNDYVVINTREGHDVSLTLWLDSATNNEASP